MEEGVRPISRLKTTQLSLQIIPLKTSLILINIIYSYLILNN